MMGDDGAGPLLAERLATDPAPDFAVVAGGSMPENAVSEVLAYRPQCVIIVDAAEMGLNPGEVRFVAPEAMAKHFIMGTHAMPLSFLMARLAEDVPEVHFLGIQPDIVAFGLPVTPKVREAVEILHTTLQTDPQLNRYAWL